MKNQRGEVVTGLMVAMMAVMMIFGMVYMHGSHGNSHDHKSAVHRQEQSEKGHQHMHDQNETVQAPLSTMEENK